MKRWLLLALAACTPVLFAAMPAQAKGGPQDFVSGQALISGPGLSKPISMKGHWPTPSSASPVG